MNTDGKVGAESQEDGAVRRWGRMKKVLLLLAVWFVVFVVVTVFNIRDAWSKYPNDWAVCIGYPDWFFSSGYGDHPGFWHGMMTEKWGVVYSYLFSAMAIAFAPLVVPVVGYLLVKRRLRFHLATAVALTLSAGGLLWANMHIENTKAGDK